MNVAIVDDMEIECERLIAFLKEYENGNHLDVRIEVFHSGRAFFREYSKGAFDIVFMDIFLNDENGIDCALKLRELDDQVNIIFLTTSSEFGVKSYDVRAIDYIVKPATAENVSRALRYCKLKEAKSECRITVLSKNQQLNIEIDRILYVDYQNRSTCIHLRDCLIQVSGSFTELVDQLAPYKQFVSCFKGILVNLMMVEDLGSDYLILKNAEKLPVSRRLQRQVRQMRLSLSVGALRDGEI